MTTNSGRLMQLASNIHNWKHWKLVMQLVACLVLVVATLYGAKQANYQQSANADNIVYPYLFQDFSTNDMVLPAKHSNILKFPLFILQAVAPYNYTTLSMVNIGLVLATVGLWAYLLTRIFGRKYLTVICLSLASFLLASSTLQNDLIGNTIRNIEYPIGLAFILVTYKILKVSRTTTQDKLLIGVVSLLMAATIAGDNLILFVIILPMLAVLFVSWLQSQSIKAGSIKALGVVIGTIITAYIIKGIVGLLGVADFYADISFVPRTVPLESISYSVTTTLTQTLNMHGATIFGITKLGPSHAIVFINFTLLLLGLIGFLAAIRRCFIDYRKQDEIKRNFIGPVLAMCFFAILAVYIIADQVVHVLPTGSLVNNFQERYLTLLPFLTVAGIVLFVKEYYPKHRSLLSIISLAILFGIVISSGYIRVVQTAANGSRANYISSVTDIVEAARKNNVKHLLTGYWYGATTRFWSQDRLEFGSMAGCNIIEPKFNIKNSWYTADPSVKRSALVIDRSGPDKGYWGCTNEQLVSIYGEPVKVVYMDGVDSVGMRQHNTIEFWIYDYDTRQKIHPSGS